MKKLSMALLASGAIALAGCKGNDGSGAWNEVSSPSGNIRVTITAEECDTCYGAVSLTADYMTDGKRTAMFEGTNIGLKTTGNVFDGNLRLDSVGAVRSIVDDYEMKTGKRSHCHNEGNERDYYFVNDDGKRLGLTVRVYGDGVAFRYMIDAEGDTLTEEFTDYKIADGVKRWIQPYDPSYERFYPLATDGAANGWGKPHKWGMPALVERDDSLFVLLAEANVTKDHCGSYLDNAQDPTVYRIALGSQDSPLKAGWTSPWRVAIMGKLPDIVESTLVTDVSKPAKGSADWIEPGTASWIYWAYNHGSKDYQTVKAYIDLAAEMGWPYVLIDWEWSDMANGGDIYDALKYANEKGIKPLLWYNSSTAWIGEGAPMPQYRLNSPEARANEYDWLKENGVAGIKVDFFIGDDKNTINYFIDLLEDGMDKQLLISLHGATVPRGWQRTYPNLMTVEGVYGAEWYNNAPVLTDNAACHNATLPFTRNVIGPMDYTPGTFSDSQHKHITTHGHELALYVAFESAAQHMPDRPEAYRALPERVKGMLKGLPTAWDDTKLLGGYPGRDVVIARCKGDKWYVAGINGERTAKTLTADLSRLGAEGRTATLFADGPTQYEFDIREITVGTDPLTVDCQPDGGFAMVIE